MGEISMTSKPIRRLPAVLCNNPAVLCADVLQYIAGKGRKRVCIMSAAWPRKLVYSLLYKGLIGLAFAKWLGLFHPVPKNSTAFLPNDVAFMHDAAFFHQIRYACPSQRQNHDLPRIGRIRYDPTVRRTCIPTALAFGIPDKQIAPALI